MRVLKFCFVMVLASAGCKDNPASSPPTVPFAIRAFVASEQLPLLRNITIDVGVSERDLILFSAEYGEPQDCPSGCFYSLGFGIAHRGSIGWTGFANSRGEPAAPTLYDVQSGDAALFEAGVWRRIEEEQTWQFWRIWLPFLASEPDTAEEALLRIATRLQGIGDPSLANRLLENPRIGQYPDVLQVLACLPDAYAIPRQQARDILGSKFTGCGEYRYLEIKQ